MSKEYPSEEELVICRIKNIERYGVFVELVEYKKEGFVHVSKITPGWVKNIRSHVREGQLRVGSVVKVDKQKDLIDLSLKKVSDVQERRRMEEWKLGKHAMKIFNRACHELKANFEDSVKKIIPPIEKEYGALYPALENCTLEGEKTFENVKIPAPWKKELCRQANESIRKPSVTIKGEMNLTFYGPDGVDKIRKIGQELTSEDVSIKYISAPRYRLLVNAPDYPTAETLLDKTLKKIESFATKNQGEFKFERK
jgi:translation initiation factor 2 subunit 1